MYGGEPDSGKTASPDRRNHSAGVRGACGACHAGSEAASGAFAEQGNLSGHDAFFQYRVYGLSGSGRPVWKQRSFVCGAFYHTLQYSHLYLRGIGHVKERGCGGGKEKLAWFLFSGTCPECGRDRLRCHDCDLSVRNSGAGVCASYCDAFE